MYREAGIPIESEIAGLLCCAIISDTLLYRSPTCTEVDKQAAEDLAKTAGVDTKVLAKEMFSAGSNLLSKSEKEIFYQDYKEFTVGSVTLGIGQINSMNTDELFQIEQRLIPYLKEARQRHKADMVFFMLTSILDESTKLIFDGGNAKQLLSEAFAQAEVSDNSAYLKGVVSRKKQLVPSLMMVLQQ